MSGYDIKKFVDAGLAHFWNENYGQIYPTLESLVADEMATKKETQSSGQRRRIVYSVTRKGRRSFRLWLSEPTAAPIVRNEQQLKFFLSGNMPADESIRLIREYQSQQQSALKEYWESEKVLSRAIEEGTMTDELDEILRMAGSTRQQRANQCKVFYLTLRHGILAIESRLAWCDEVLQSLEQ